MAQVRTEDDWAALDDDEFVAAAQMQIWLSAYASNNPRAPSHKEVDKAYSAAVKRGKPELYERAWKKAARSAGMDV